MNWMPSAGPEVLVVRARLLTLARQFFSDRHVMEVQTPVLVSSGCPDPAIPSIIAQPQHGATRYLHTSPEHAMKRLLCAGSGDIYQIGPVFRDGEAGRNHNPEFTMIEWYRLGFDHHGMAAETASLIHTLLDIQSEMVKISYRDAFIRYAGVDPAVADTPALIAVCERNDIAPPSEINNDRDACLDLLLSTLVGPAFPPDQLHILYDYPATQAALARIRPDTPPAAERFEVFYGGLELANGFNELQDPVEQRQRFESEQARHTRSGREPPPIDERLLAALSHGLPDCAGVALGFDRLVMLATNTSSLAEAIPFSFDNA